MQEKLSRLQNFTSLNGRTSGANTARELDMTNHLTSLRSTMSASSTVPFLVRCSGSCSRRMLTALSCMTSVDRLPPASPQVS
jgi:hypothetical protein